ncbi:MAG TPA: sensor domain-containing diguanylate cyclase [Kofleriaceae bacterium]|jgi:diguanylate cyclase (GGDEF)-like protein|nr:sensor domain-containing diguanylate cyclase [Kofleriaceae bacterium]
MSARPRLQLAYSLAFGAIGWGALLAWTFLGDAPPPSEHGPLVFAAFLLVILATRAMAFQLAPGSVLSLDSGFYVAAAVALGPRAAGLMVALALTLDTLTRLVRAERRAPGVGDGAEQFGYVFYFGGMTGALVGGAAWLVGPPTSDAGELTACLRVFAIGGVVLMVHNAIQGARHVLGGRAVGAYVRDQAVPGMIAELSVLPLAAVVVLLYQADRPLGFGLLAATYLLLNLVFNRLSRASQALRARVRELEILDTAARQLASSLELQELVATVARETLRAIPAAETVALCHRGPERDTDRFVVDCYDRGRDAFARLRVGRTEGAMGRVVASLAPLAIDDLAHSDVDPGPAGTEGVRSWLGVPIFMNGGCEGVLVVQSRAPAAFTGQDQRLLTSIALQVAAALQNAHLYEMAMVDGLTGLFVRRYFDARIDEEIERARRYGTPFAVVMMDIDDFKHLNDTHGHLAGDRVLREVAAQVKRQMRGVDTAARYGGEEIALILPRTELVAALNQAERIRGAIADHRVSAGEDGPVLGVTASFGIAAFPESGAEGAEELVRRADRALYRAKKTGKNRVELYWGDESGRTAIAG